MVPIDGKWKDKSYQQVISLSFPFSVLSTSYCFLGLLIVSYECRLMYHFSSFSQFEI